MEFISDALLSYSEDHSEPETDLLKELNRETHLKVTSPRMLSGHLQGRFLSFLSTLITPRLIVEIGTYTGYSALCLAEGLPAGGQLITIDPNEETNHFAKKYFDRSSFRLQIKQVQGQATDIIPTLQNNIDLVFIDADKKNYARYFDLIVDKVRKGGLIISDNVLWSGKVLGEHKDAETQAIHNYNAHLKSDPRVRVVLLPLRDGLSICIKK